MLHFQIDPQREREGEGKVGSVRVGSLATSMESINGVRVSSITPSTAEDQKPVSPDLRQAISSVLSRWNGLEMAVKNQWGGRDSIHKAQQLSADILSWLSQSKPGT